MGALERVFPGPIRQNAYLVDDLQAAVRPWLRAGIGPWIVLRSMTQADSEYRGEKTGPAGVDRIRQFR